MGAQIIYRRPRQSTHHPRPNSTITRAERGNIPGRIDDDGRKRLAELNRSRAKA
jgi:hypothetical protein